MRNFKKLFGLFMASVLPLIVFAQGGEQNPDAGGGTTLTNYLKDPFSRGVPCLIEGILKFLVEIGIVVLVIMIVWTGLKFVMAKGNPGEITKAKDAMYWTLIGATLVLGAFVIAEAVKGTIAQLGTLPDGSPASCDAVAEPEPSI